MPETKRFLKVFISYASQDRPIVQELSRRLAGEGWIDPWVDKKKLLPGQDWRTKIEEAVETSDVAIICLSSNSVTKEGFVQKELRYAREIAFEKPDETIFLIPLRLNDCSVPRGLRFYQWGDYFDKEKEETYNALLESLKLRYEQKLKLDAEEQAQKEKERIALAKKALKDADEKAHLEAEEHAQKEEVEKERKATEKAAQEKEKLDVAEKASRDPTERRTDQKVVFKENFSKSFNSFKLALPKAVPFLGVIGAGLLIVVLWFVSWAVPIFPPPTPTIGVRETVTPNSTPSPTSTNPPPTDIATIVVSPPVEALVDCVYTIHEGDKDLSEIAERFGIGGNNYPLIKNFDGTPIHGISPGQFVLIPGVFQNKCLQEIGMPRQTKDAVGVPIVLIPAGEFTMGSNDGFYFEGPAQMMDLGNYYIDKYEVTNAFYKACVDAGACLPPTNSSSETRPSYYGNPDFDDYPVVFVNWFMAKAYCEWRGARLPTEAEWEKAARDADARTYPWGNASIDEAYANYNNYVGDTMAVGSYEKGVSPFGVLDMAGNVWEWVSSLDQPYPYDPQDGREDLSVRGDRILRGGSWNNDLESYLTTYYRALNIIDNSAYDYLGFRCAEDVP